MKVCLYFEGKEIIKTSGIGRALKHQMAACESAGISYTLDPDDDYDVLHINTVGVSSLPVINKARAKGCKVIYHAHSTEEDFRNSFVLSNQIAPVFKKMLISYYSKADLILTPTPYSKKLLEGYGITVPIYALSNGIDLNRFHYDLEKVKAFRRYFSLKDEDKVVISVGLYFERKGILDFMEVAENMPDVKFIWFGYTPLISIPKKIRDVVTDEHPTNVILPGYVKGAVIEGAYANADCFFFPSYEETEGIVVLEALASSQNVLLRDIPVYDPWLVHGQNCYKGKNNEEFIAQLRKILNHECADLREQGRITAEKRSIQEVGRELKKIYEGVCEGNI
ncbi:glycosyltransferase family 4 protein [Traorella massiliensis]|uniref:glycosyltransferase family 4 protein n=1 Tax=Traorella massiliensis TaxID=1903263 RepID=UPI00248DC450|nr:glycosyltransferase family 4 protein [Traorella massiliensis]